MLRQVGMVCGLFYNAVSLLPADRGGFVLLAGKQVEVFTGRLPALPESVQGGNGSMVQRYHGFFACFLFR